MPTERRFRGTLTSEYELFDLACPKGPILDATLRAEIRRYKPGHRAKTLECLELGFGTGLTTKVILDSRPDLRVIAVDSEPQMKKKAAKTLATFQAAGRLKLTVADALTLLRKTPTASIDIVATAATLHNFSADYRDAVWRELARVLRRGGLFVNVDKYAQSGPEHAKAIKARMNRYFGVAVPRGRFDWLKSVVLHYMADESPERRMDEMAQAKMMRSVGFERIRRVYRMDMTAVVVAVRS